MPPRSQRRCASSSAVSHMAGGNCGRRDGRVLGPSCRQALIPPRVAFVEEGHRPGAGDVAGLQLFHPESGGFDHCVDRAVEMAAAGDAPPDRRQAVLPASDGGVRRQAVLHEQQAAGGAQDAA